jgi:hypothetical protein
MAVLRFTLMIVLGIAVFAGDVRADEIFVKPDPRTGGIILDNKQDDDVVAEAQTPEEFANGFFRDCIRQDHPILRGGHLEMFCGCTSAKITETMTLKEMKATKRDSEHGQFQRNRMLMFVYAPCLAYPVREMTIEQCLGNKDTLKDSTGTCTCAGDKISEYILIESPKVIERMISYNKLSGDPISQFLESAELELHNKEYMTHCVAQYEEGQF